MKEMVNQSSCCEGVVLFLSKIKKEIKEKKEKKERYYIVLENEGERIVQKRSQQ